MKIALITGAGSGIGRHTALSLMKNGFTVILAGRNHERLEETRALAKTHAHNGHAIPADVTNPDSVVSLFSQIKCEFGRLDLLFNNAGVNAPGVLLEEVEFNDWQRVIATNLSGVFLCTQQAFILMKEQMPAGGRIINNGSLSAHTPRPNSAPYTASKHAISGLTKASALDGRKYNIACCQIDIGNAATSMVSKIQQGAMQADGSIAAEPTMRVEEVAEAVLFMANLPLTSNVQQMTVMATKMPFVGRG